MRTLAAILLIASSSALAEAPQGRVIEIDANTKIRHDPRLGSVTGTDPAAAGGGVRERAREEAREGAAGPGPDGPVLHERSGEREPAGRIDKPRREPTPPR